MLKRLSKLVFTALVALALTAPAYAGEFTMPGNRTTLKRLIPPPNGSQPGVVTIPGPNMIKTSTVAPGANGNVLTSNGTAWQSTKYLPTGYLTGLGLSNSGSNSIVIAAGAARDSTDTASLVLSSSLTKDVSTAWAVGSGSGGLDTGAVGNNVYYLYLIERLDTGVVDAIFSLNSSAPTLPTNYTVYVKIGKFNRASSANNAPRSYAQDRLGPTDWVSWTPTFTAFGTVTSVSMWSRRNGDTLEIRGKFTSGTATASEARVSLGFNGTDGNVISDPTKVASIQLTGLGPALGAANGNGAIYILIESGVGYVTFALGNVNNGTSLTKINGNSVENGANATSFYASIPIAGW